MGEEGCGGAGSGGQRIGVLSGGKPAAPEILNLKSQLRAYAAEVSHARDRRAEGDRRETFTGSPTRSSAHCEAAKEKLWRTYS